MYSDAWLYDYENKDPTVESLQEQYRYIESVINKSLDRDHQHSQQYEDLSIAKLPVSHFLGDQKPPTSLCIDPVPKDNCDSIPYTSAYVNRQQKQILYAKDIHEKYRYVSELNAVLRGRQYVDNVLREFVDSIKHLIKTNVNSVLNAKHQELNNRKCYRSFVDTFNNKCFNINQHLYSSNKLFIFVNICESLGQTSDADIAVNHLMALCNKF